MKNFLESTLMTFPTTNICYTEFQLKNIFNEARIYCMIVFMKKLRYGKMKKIYISHIPKYIFSNTDQMLTEKRDRYKSM